MTRPWLEVEPVPADAFEALRRRAIFDCCKWDAQVEDVSTVAPFALVLTAASWSELTVHAESLARETIAVEAELIERPQLHKRLGLPRRARRALRAAAEKGAARGAARLIRFDFHHTSEGWRITEANTDVPGGINEASGFGALFAPHHPHAAVAGDPAGALTQTLLHEAGAGARVALLHATSYSDDRQVMTYLARSIERAGMMPVFASPSHVRWRQGYASLETDWCSGPIDLALRFFPGEWLIDLPSRTGWHHWFAGGMTPSSNPATALLTQSKRLPLVWDELRTPLDAWRTLLPETRDPREVDWWGADAWVLKPALGRVGDGVCLRGVATEQEWQRTARAAVRNAGDWVVQRRFEATSLTVGDVVHFPCVGVYTIDGRAVGAYGRSATRPLIDWRAQDVAVLVQTGDRQ